MMPPHEIVYRFLEWQVEPASHQLTRSGTQIHLTPKAMDVLVYLLASGGRVISKEEFLREVWGGRAVTDDALIVAVHEVRKALGDRAREPTYVETVVRRGYRFLPRVEISRVTTPEIVETELRSDPGLERTPGHSYSQMPERTPGPRRRSLALAFLVLTCATVGLAIATRKAAFTADAEGSDPTASHLTAETLLLQARRDLDRRTGSGAERAEQMYRRLEELHRGDPRAEAGLARVAALRADLRLGDRFQLYYEARSRAEDALALDPNLVDAHLALATTRLIVDWDFAAAAESLDRALSISPEDPEVHKSRAWWLSAQGHHLAASQSARQAVTLDPGSASGRADLAFFLMLRGQYAEAMQEAEAALVLDPTNGAAWGAVIRTHLALNDLGSATRELLAMLEALGASPQQMAVWKRLGDQGYWVLADRLSSGAQLKGSMAVARASALANLDRMDEAYVLLERAIERRDWEILWLESLPELRGLRTNSERFQKLIERRISNRSANRGIADVEVSTDTAASTVPSAALPTRKGL